MIPRDYYTNELEKFKDIQLIKVVTGIRRCGKSTLLRLFREQLVHSGVAAKRIQNINLEDPANRHLLDWESLYDHVNSHLVSGQKNYIFFDEVQAIPQFERAIDSLFINEDVDLYVTGSNARLLSSEIATLLTGRYVEIEMYPLSFAEYSSAYADQQDANQRFADYLKYGGFPQTVELRRNSTADAAQKYLRSIYDTVLYKDIMARTGSDNRKLEAVTRFLFDNVGNITSPKKIADTITSDGISITRNTIDSYLNSLVDSLVIYPIGRYEVKGRKLLQTLGKYYVVDTGLRTTILGSSADIDRGHTLENVVYLELRRRYSDVWIGKVGNTEVDFVVRDHDGRTTYYQVAASVTDTDTLTRELRPLRAIADDYPKYLLTLDAGSYDYDGIQQQNIVHFLLKN